MTNNGPTFIKLTDGIWVDATKILTVEPTEIQVWYADDPGDRDQRVHVNGSIIWLALRDEGGHPWSIETKQSPDSVIELVFNVMAGHDRS